MLLRTRSLVALAAMLAPLPTIAFACSSTRENTAQDTRPLDPNGSAPDMVPNVTDASWIDAADGGHCSDYARIKNVYWGDLHTHSSFSVDAYSSGTRNTPFDAYEFAMGRPKQIAAGLDAGITWQLPRGRALDFDAVTDHSEWLGVSFGCGDLADGGKLDPDASYYASPSCAQYRAQDGTGDPLSIANHVYTANGCVERDGRPSGEVPGTPCNSVTTSAWQAEKSAASAANLRCKFTSLVGYEWSAVGPNQETLHHNVIFGPSGAPSQPFDSLDYPLNTDLWSALDRWRAADPACADAGTCAAITIPHNSNQSQGLAFLVPTLPDGGTDRRAVEQMERYQRLVEIHQHKGDSECYAGDGGTDDACNFEHTTPELQANYVRYALGDGIRRYAAARDAGAADAANPLKLGVVGATDDHNGLPGNVAENDWPGHVGVEDDSPKKRLNGTPDFNPGGLTAVWAEENTRESVFAALTRREVFATSGPRIVVRFYQTWSDTDLCGPLFPANVIDAGGVPMGGDIPPGPPGRVPKLVVSATKDLTDLARIDIVKTRVIAGSPSATIASFDVAPPDAGGSVCVTWRDTSFDPAESAVYYARVLEKPTPRWSTYDCARIDGGSPSCAPGKWPETIQERAWTSPIWWQP